ncbi:MAG: tail fiber domain-containing protein [Bacteroidales bacterium]|nr:tail fiber domain-containing protein [Bacteroidales bacterium]
MKRLILTSALLSLILLIAQPMRAQVKVLSSSFEVAKQRFQFTGKEIKLDVYGSPLEISNSFLGTNSVPSNNATNGGVIGGGGDPMLPTSGIICILGNKNGITVGSTGKPLHSVYATDLYGKNSALSDRRYKTNIADLNSALAKIMRLRPVKFDYLEEKDNLTTVDSSRMNNVGLIAQELLEVVPEAVQYLLPDDIYMVSYTTLIPFLIKSIQEQQALIENQQLQIEELQMALTPDNAAFATPTFSSVQPNSNPAEAVAAASNKLWSNVPNPFKQETRIRYALTEDVREAQLCIYDLSGKQLSCHRLNDRGESEFVLRAAALNPGIYLYSLIADGQVVDTHRMVVTE